MAAKRGKQPRQQHTGFRLSLTNTCDPYLLSSGPTKSKTRNCGKRQGKKEWRCKLYAANEAGSATHCANQKIMSQAKH